MARRLFVAIDLPSDCRHALERANPGLAGVRWQWADKLHLTLSFLGEVEADAEKRLHQVLPQIVSPPFALEIRGVGTFGERYPKVLWADVGNGRTELEKLQIKVRRAISESGLSQDPRPFHPHVTLSRPRNVSRARLETFLEHHAEVTFGAFLVRELVLYASETGPEGSTYRVLLRHSLQRD